MTDAHYSSFQRAHIPVMLKLPKAEDEQIHVTLCDPIDYRAAHQNYAISTDHESRRRALCAPIDMAMRAIAEATDLPYIDEPIELWPRKTMILESGEEVPIPDR